MGASPCTGAGWCGSSVVDCGLAGLRWWMKGSGLVCDCSYVNLCCMLGVPFAGYLVSALACSLAGL